MATSCPKDAATAWKAQKEWENRKRPSWSLEVQMIRHSRTDDVIPFADSEELVANSGLPPETLVEVGNDNRLADPEPLKAMLEACERLTQTGLQLLE